MEKNLICIGCPLGCSMSIILEDKKVSKVTGNSCSKGEKYAKKEMIDPRRIVTATIRIINGEIPLLSVKTREDIPKNKIFDCINELNNTIVDAPIKVGDTILENICNTGIDIIATKTVHSKFI